MRITEKQQRYAQIARDQERRLLAALAGGETPKFTAEQVGTRVLQAREQHRCASASSSGSRASTGATPRPCARSASARGVLARTHGSALFTRGETQALVVTTLGTGRDAQIIDGLTGERKEPFMLHYNFPPFRWARPA